MCTYRKQGAMEGRSLSARADRRIIPLYAENNKCVKIADLNYPIIIISKLGLIVIS